jgi:hypothetical protein
LRSFTGRPFLSRTTASSITSFVPTTTLSSAGRCPAGVCANVDIGEMMRAKSNDCAIPVLVSEFSWDYTLKDNQLLRGFAQKVMESACISRTGSGSDRP